MNRCLTGLLWGDVQLEGQAAVRVAPPPRRRADSLAAAAARCAHTPAPPQGLRRLS